MTLRWTKNLILQTTYNITGYVIEAPDAMVAFIHNGDYAGEGIIEKDGEVLFKWRAYVSIVKL